MFGQHDHNDEDNKHEEHMIRTSDDPQPSDRPSGDTWQHPGVPLGDDATQTQSDDGAASDPGGDQGHSNGYSDHGFSHSQDDHAGASSDGIGDEPDEDLSDLKLEALSKLSPLVNHLDQTPEEKFRTLMMMIQASDDQSLIKQAYQTSLSISDEKERAQALLDIVNEINYFTQNPNNG